MKILYEHPRRRLQNRFQNILRSIQIKIIQDCGVSSLVDGPDLTVRKCLTGGCNCTTVDNYETPLILVRYSSPFSGYTFSSLFYSDWIHHMAIITLDFALGRVSPTLQIFSCQLTRVIYYSDIWIRLFYIWLGRNGQKLEMIWIVVGQSKKQ